MIGTGASQCSIVRALEHGSVFDSSLIRVRVNCSLLDPQFLYYFFWSPEGRAEVDSIGRHGPISGITGRDLATLPIPVPVIEEQRAIARILGTLDDKIELNHRVNQALEDLCSILFKFWFVDFGPVRAKAEGRWRKGKSLLGMPADMWDLWPSEFQQSEIGEVPKGWSVEGLSGIGHFQNGLACQRFPPQDGRALPVLKISELRSGTLRGADVASADVPKDYVTTDGDLIFSWSGSLEVKFWYGGKAVLNQHLFKVTSEAYPLWFCHGWLLERLEEFRAIAEDKATTMGHIQRRHLDEALVVVPPRVVLTAASVVLTPLRELILAGELESRTLTDLRDTLLPKLLSGEVRVKVDA